MTVMNPERVAYSRMVYEHILANPELHNQESFGSETPCGTAHCIAGWAVTLDPQADIKWYSDSTHDGDLNWSLHVDGKPVDVETRASELLGLDWISAHRLFYDMGNRSALRTFRKWIEEAEAA